MILELIHCHAVDARTALVCTDPFQCSLKVLSSNHLMAFIDSIAASSGEFNPERLKFQHPRPDYEKKNSRLFQLNQHILGEGWKEET